MLRDIFNLADVFSNSLKNYDPPARTMQYPKTGREQMTKIVPETVVSTGCSIDRTLITLLEMDCRYFSKGGFVALIYAYR
ncbi:hypothetical protein ACFL2E_04830 [Thermodesulfobacteriota bacterium]